MDMEEYFAYYRDNFFIEFWVFFIQSYLMLSLCACHIKAKMRKEGLVSKGNNWKTNLKLFKFVLLASSLVGVTLGFMQLDGYNRGDAAITIIPMAMVTTAAHSWFIRVIEGDNSSSTQIKRFRNHFLVILGVFIFWLATGDSAYDIATITITVGGIVLVGLSGSGVTSSITGILVVFFLIAMAVSSFS